MADVILLSGAALALKAACSTSKRETPVPSRARRLCCSAVEELDLDDAVLVIIPGHETAASNDGTPLACAAATIASAAGFTAASDSLIRTTSIEKLAKGGNRSIEVHLNSMELSEPDIISGETVVILDDIVTSGNSIAAARQLLEVAGARRIAAVAVGRTKDLY